MSLALATLFTDLSFSCCHATRSNTSEGRSQVRPKKINDFRSTITGFQRRGPKPKNDLEMLEAMLWILRTGAPWRDLPKSFPPWESVYSRICRWTELGLWAHLLAYFRSELADEEYLMIDSSGVRVHQDASRVKEANFQQAMGRSKGGLSTKIHMACDALGYLLGFILTGAERHKVENLFQKIKRYRRVAMRFEKLQATFAAMIAIASILAWIKF